MYPEGKTARRLTHRKSGCIGTKSHGASDKGGELHDELWYRETV